jgi:hypothetical protein
MKFEQSEFSKLKYPIHKIPLGTPVLFEFKDLENFSVVFAANDLPKRLDPDIVLRYLIYMYDLGSPGQGIPDLKRRKTWALQCLNIEPPYDQYIVDMLSWKIKGVNRRAIYFLLLMGGEQYMVWKSAEEALLRYTELEIKLEAEDEAAQAKIIQAEKTRREIINMTMSQIAASKNDFLQGEKSKDLEDELTEFTLLDSLGIRPEEYIREFEQNGDVFPDIDA